MGELTTTIPVRPIDPPTMERLAFVRYLYQLGVEQSQKPEPANAVAILTLHDAADSLLQLASEFLPAPLKNKGQAFLLNYFEAVADAIAVRGELEGKTAMIRLGRTRDNLKHHGVRPSSRDIEALRAGAANFFESNVPLIFGVEFDRISMARVIVVPLVKEALEESEGLIAAGQLKDAVVAIKVAFGYLMKRQHQIEPPHKKGREISFAIRMSAKTGTDRVLGEVAKEVERLSGAVETLQERLTFLSLDIEPANLERFRRLTPDVEVFRDGTRHVSYFGDQPQHSLDDVRFCYDFVVGVALALQRRS